VRVCVLPKTLGEHSDQFQLILEEPKGGARFDPATDGGEKRCVLTVNLRNENDALADENRVLRFHRWVDGVCNKDAFREGTENWKEEISNVIFEVGDLEEGQKPSAADYVLHLVGLPWRLFFALVVPPLQYLEGWIAFVMSLLAIGALTAVIIDFAELFGCVTGVQDSITAITFVALGTSMPDLFASLAACKEDETADASVVNVTGSNSVNVFLGLGLPWSICSIYWAFKERTSEWAACYPETAARLDAGGHGSSMVFVVDSGFIGFSVVTFCCVCLSAIAIVMIRRKYLHAELGGPFVPKITCGAVLIFFWLSWIFVVSWRVLRYEDQTLLEQAVVGFAFLCVVLLGLMFAFASVYKHRLSSVQVREAREVRRFSAETGSIDLSSVQGFAGQPGDKAASLGELPSAERIGSKDQSSGELTPATDCDQSGRGVAPHCNLVEGV